MGVCNVICIVRVSVAFIYILLRIAVIDIEQRYPYPRLARLDCRYIHSIYTHMKQK